MKEIVDRILQEEEQARRKIEDAGRQAQTLVQQARQQAEETAEKQEKEALGLIEKKKQEAFEAFSAQKAAVLDQTRQEILARRQSKQTDTAALAEKTFRRIIAIP
jgi:vacuolar-type H+-ATPase subunit H